MENLGQPRAGLSIQPFAACIPTDAAVGRDDAFLRNTFGEIRRDLWPFEPKQIDFTRSEMMLLGKNVIRDNSDDRGKEM